MFHRLVEEIRTEARSGYYGRYDVDRSRSHFGTLLRGLHKVTGGAIGTGLQGARAAGKGALAVGKVIHRAMKDTDTRGDDK